MTPLRPRPVAPGSQSPRAGMFKSAKREELLRQGAGKSLKDAARAKAAGAGYGNKV